MKNFRDKWNAVLDLTRKGENMSEKTDTPEDQDEDEAIYRRHEAECDRHEQIEAERNNPYRWL